MAKYILKKKYKNTQEEWLEVYKNIENYISKEEIEAKIQEAIKRIKKVIKGKKVAYAWSGGKDSIALQIIMEKIGINSGVCAISRKFEYTDFLEYINANLPVGIEVIDKEVSFEYLNKHRELIFPQNKKDLAKWYKLIQHNIQNEYFKKNKLDILILGRRLQDGNYVGKDGIYTKNNDITIYSPIYDWKHEDILAVLHYYNKELPSFYFRDNGFNEGTHNVVSKLGSYQDIIKLLSKYEKEKLNILKDNLEKVKEIINEE